MKIIVKAPRKRSGAARMLADARYRKRVVRSKKQYSRKGHSPSSRKYDGSIQFMTARKQVAV